MYVYTLMPRKFFIILELIGVYIPLLPHFNTVIVILSLNFLKIIIIVVIETSID